MSKFSVIIPLYNKEKDVQKTLDSLFAQTFGDFEVIVVNDGSTDRSLQVVQAIRDGRLRIFDKKNEGVGPTRNYGVRQSTSEYIAFLDADDYWYPNHLQCLSDLIDSHPKGKWFATAYEKKHNEKLITAMLSPVMEKKPWRGVVSDYFGNSLIDALAWTSAVCMRKDFFEDLNGFDTSITNGAGEDTDLWLRAALKSSLIFTTEISAIHNLNSSNRISFTPTKNRNFMDPDNYEKEAQTNPSLKKYLDVNRFSFALQHKMAGDSATFKKYIRGLDPSNLTRKQRFLLQMPRQLLFLLKRIKHLLELSGRRTTSFK